MESMEANECMKCVEVESRKVLLYQNPLSCEEDLKGFILEGNANMEFLNGKLRLSNAMSAEFGQKANYVLWCPVDFPDNIMIQWKFKAIEEPGLAILFFAAKGMQGEDLFDGSLKKRTGEYPQYHHGDINAFHVSYFRRKEGDERAFHTCNLRKSYGFHLVAQGADPIPDAKDAKESYDMVIKKKENEVTFWIDDLLIFRFIDDNKTFGPLLGGGKIGFRQLAPMVGEYWDLKVYAI